MAQTEADTAGEGARAELSQLVDELLEEVQEVRRQWHQLDDVLARIDGTGGEQDDAQDQGESPRAPAEPGAGDNPVELMAREMMRGGRSRAETADYLAQTFGLDPDEALLDRVFEEGGGQ